MAYDPNSRRGASEGRALRNVEQLLDEHRQSIIEANLLSDALAQQVTVVRGQAEKSGQKSSPTLDAQQKLSHPNINRARSGSSGSSGSRVSGRGQSMPRTTQSIDRPATARPSLGLNAAARKGPTSVSGYTPPYGASPNQRPSSGGRAQPSTKAASPRMPKVANRPVALNRTSGGPQSRPNAPRFADFLAAKELMKDGLMRLGWQPGVAGSPPPRDTEIFKLMDIKGDGVIDPQELKIGLTRLRKGWVESEELKRVLSAYDTNGDGVLQPSEFSAFVRGLDFEERAARHVVDPLEKELLQLADDPLHLPAASDQNHGTGNALRHDKTSSLSVLEQPDGAQPNRSSVPIPKCTAGAGGAPAPGRSSNGGPGARASGPGKAPEPKLSRLQSAAAGASLKTLASRPSVARRSNSRLSDEPPEEEVKGGEIAYGVQREAWNAAVQQFALQEPSRSGSNGSSGYGSSGNRGRSSPNRTAMVTSNLEAMLHATGCGLRTDERFLGLLELKLDPSHRGVIQFADLKKWLQSTMALIGAVAEASSGASTPRAFAPGPESRAQMQMDAVAAANAAVPSLDHPALDAAILALARLRMHAPPRTPLHADLTSVLRSRGYLPTAGPVLVGPDVARVLARYDDRGGGFVAAGSLRQLLDDLDFYFPGEPGSTVERAAQLAFQAKLDFFGENRAGVSTAALHVWWADLEVVVGALDAALSTLATATDDAMALAPGNRVSGSGGAVLNAASELVAAVARANATCAPLGHRMLDEALAALHRQHVLGHEGYQPLLPLLATESGHSEGPLPLPFDADACDVIQPQTPALLSLACLGGLLACQEIVALHFGSHKPTARLDARSLPQLLHDVGLRAPQKAEQLEALASRLSTEGEDGSMVLEAGPVAHGFTGARLKLERLQAALLYATGSVATFTSSQSSGNNGEASFSAALIDDDCAERLESALDAALVPIPVPVNSHPLVVEARRVLADRRKMAAFGSFSTEQPGPNQPQVGNYSSSTSTSTSNATAASGAFNSGVGGSTTDGVVADDSNWHLIESTSDRSNVYWYNELTGESRWDTPERIRAKIVADCLPEPGISESGQQDEMTEASSAEFLTSAGAAVSHFREMVSKLQATVGVLPAGSQHAQLLAMMGQVEGRLQKVEAARMGVQSAHTSIGGSAPRENAPMVTHAKSNSPRQGSLRTYRKTTSGNLSENEIPDMSSPKVPKSAAPKFFSANPSPTDNAPIVANASSQKSLATQLWSTPKSDVSQSTPQDGGREEFYKSEAETAWDIIFDYLIDPTLFAGIEDLFRALDRKGNGRLDHYDLEQGLLSSGCPLTNTMVTELRKNLDKNGDGTVDLDEFLAAARENSARHAATNVLVQEAWDILNRFVINTTGMRQDVCTLFRRTGQENNVLAFDELSRGLRGLGLKISNPQLKALYPEIDANKDGKISLQEWVTAIEEYRQASPEEDAQTLLNAWDSILDETLTSDGLASIKSMFKLADVDGDGGLSLQELARGLLSCGIRMTPRQLRLLQRDLDENKDGDISFEEFESKVQRFQAASPLNREAADEAWDLAINVFMDPNRNESVSDMFRRMDKDGNLEVDISELAQGMASLGVPLTARQLRGFQKTLDSNGDGSISHSEFVQALRRERVKLEDALTDAWNKVIECTIGDVHGKVRDLFDSMDTSNDGVLDMTELSMGLRLMGISLSPRAERAFLKDVDTSGEGEVDFDEFLEGIRRYQQSSEIDEDAAHEAWQVLLKYFAGDTANAELHSLFKHFDEDKSQGLDLAELARGLLGIGLHLTSKQLRALQKSLDKNGDGKITFQEFMLSIEDKQANKLSGSWEQVTSTSDGATYWHNTVTGETSWDPPNILQKSVPSKMPAVNRSNDVHLPSSQPFAYSNYEKIPVDSEGVSAWDHILDFLFYPNLFEGIENLFRVLDRDGNGRLDYPELEKYFQTSGFMLTESMSAGLRKDLDKNGDGTVDLNELIASARVHGSRQSTKTVLTDEAWSILNKFVVESTRWGKGARILFKEIDTNNSNVLAFDDFLRGLRQLGLAISNDHIKALYLDMDTSKDGKISFAEWIVAIEEHDRATSVGDAQMLLNAWDFIMDVSLDPNGMGSIQKLFQVADVDGDGNLSLQELARGFLSCGIEMTPRQLRLIQHDLDENKDGSISYDEFTSKVQRFQATSPLNREAADEAWDLAINVFMDPNRNESVSDMFRRMDKDGNLEVDIDELAQGMVSLGVPLTARQLRGFQKTLDSNGDGSISHSEFVQALRLERVKLEDALTDAWNKVIECTIGDIKGKVRSLFDAMDTSNDGVLDMKELSMGLRLIGVNLPPRAERAFLKDVDTSGEGEIDFEEFLEGVRRFQQSSEIDEDAAHEAWIVLLKYFANEGSSTELRSLFVRMDENRNQSLDLAELARGLLGIGLHLTSKQLRALQKSLDKNGDGKITFQEFMLSIEDKQAIVAARAWEQVTSTSDGAMYWHNTITGETSWDAPP